MKMVHAPIAKGVLLNGVVKKLPHWLPSGLYLSASMIASNFDMVIKILILMRITTMRLKASHGPVMDVHLSLQRRQISRYGLFFWMPPFQ